MKTFQFESNLVKENGKVNVVYSDTKFNNDGYDVITHRVLNNRSTKSNLELGHVKYFSSLEEIKKSKLFRENCKSPIVIVEMIGTDCSKWNIIKIAS